MRTRGAAWILSLAGALACHAPHGDGVFPLPGSAPERERLRYADGQVSLNDSCMVRVSNALAAGMTPLYVNGRPVGFC